VDEAQFWRVIEAAKEKSKGEVEEQAEIVATQLAQYTPEEIVEFDKILDRLMARSYTNELWAACYILNGGCSDDGFDYFRGWLISQGEAIFNRALQDPQSLADVELPEDDNLEAESILYVAWTAYEERTGSEFPMGMRSAPVLTGEEWTEEELEEKYPRLVEKSSVWS